MNQERIGQLIKNIRLKSGLTQEKFAQKYGVTYQAVSKWENGKSVPDISILKKISEDANIDLKDLLEGIDVKSKKRKYIYFIMLIIIFLTIAISSIIIIKKSPKDDFNFSTLSTTCKDFELFGSIAYNDNKTSIYIDNVTYCGDKNEDKYKNIECTLYEATNENKTKISSVSLENDTSKTLDNFLSNISFNVEHFSKSCKSYRENGLFIEIDAITEDNKQVFFKIPLELKDKCS